MGANTFHDFDDFKIGQTFTSGPILVTAEDIIVFARQFDPQFFHLDPEAAKGSVFGEHVASGWHTAAITMRLLCEAAPAMDGGMIGRSVEKMNFPRAVKPGDNLSLKAKIMEKRVSNSTPNRGILRILAVTSNQKNEPVLEMETVVFVPLHQQIKKANQRP